MKRPKILSASFVRTINRPGRYGDGRGGHGLSLLVKPMTNGRLSKTWSQRLLINGKPVNIGLGAYPLVSLADARRTSLENRQALLKGRDPRGSMPLFSQAAEEVIRIHAIGWRDGGKSVNQWRASLRDYALPTIGHKRINAITTSDILALLLPHWHDRMETMRRVKQRIGAVMKWAIANGYREDDPTITLSAALPKNGVGRHHHKALPYAEVSSAIEKVRASGAYWATVACFEFMTLTAVRSGEARLARWDDIDLETATWAIPGESMKSKRPHRVPLSNRALEILKDASRYADRSGLVFPGMSCKALSKNALSKLLVETNIGCVPHGMRSSFRQWAAERTNQPREVCELALAHVNSNRIEAAYQRSDLFELRRRLMAQWAGYLAAEKAAVTAIR